MHRDVFLPQVARHGFARIMGCDVLKVSFVRDNGGVWDRRWPHTAPDAAHRAFELSLFRASQCNFACQMSICACCRMSAPRTRRR
jgi:hypothetical protein